MIFRRLDDFLIDRVFQPLVDRFPDAGPAGVARFFITGSIVADCAHQLLGSSESAFCFTIVLAIQVFWYATADRPSPRLGQRNPRRIDPSQMLCRLSSLLFLTLSSIALPSGISVKLAIDVCGYALWSSYFFAVACDRLPPPRTSRASIWQRLTAWVPA